MNKAILNFRQKRVVRKQAEEGFAKKAEKDRKLSSHDASKLEHELLVKQIALEMQNEELRKAQQELEASRSKYADLYDFAPVGYFTLDKNNVILDVNFTGATLLGIERSLLKNKPFSYYVAKDSQEIFFLHRQQVFSEKNKNSCEVELIKNDGTSFHAKIESLAAVDSEGNINYHRTAVSDVTELKQAEALLRQSQRELEIRNQIANIFLTITDDKMFGEVLQVFLKALESTYGVFGYIDEDGANVVPSMTRDIWDKCQIQNKDIVFPRETWGDSSWPRAVREKKTIYSNEPSTATPKGHISIRRHISQPIIYAGEVIGLIQVANKETDYTENDLKLLQTIGESIAPILKARLQRDLQEKQRRQVEAELKESKEFLENIFLTSVEGLIVSDVLGHITKLNPTVIEIFGYTEQELIGMHFAELSQDSNYTMGDNPPFIERLLEEGFVENHVTECKRKDGTAVFVEINIAALKDQEGKIIGWISSVRDRTERKQAEKKIKDAKDSLENIFKVSPDIIMLTDEMGNITSINAAVDKILGYSPEELIGKHSSIFRPDEELYKKTTEDMITNLMEEGFVINFECYWRKNRGGNSPIECSTLLLKNDTEDIIGGVSFARDITERKASEEKVQKAKEQLENFLENSIDPIVVSDNTGHIVKPNKAFLDMIGYSEEEIIGMQAAGLTVTEPGTYESTTGEQITITDEFFWDSYVVTGALFETGKTINWESYFLHKSGKIIPVIQNISLIYDNDGKITSSFSIVRDLTEQKKAEAVLRESEERFRAIAESSMDAIITTDDQNNIIFCNPAAERMFSYSKEELTGQPAGMLLPERFREQNKNSFQNALKQEMPQMSGKPIEACGLKKDKQDFPIEVSVITYQIDDKVYFTSTVHDITERKQMEEQIRQSQKMEAIGTLAGGVAHDLNNILSAMISYPELLLLSLPEESPLRKPIASIKSAGEKAAAIVSDLLTLARRGVNVSEVVNLNAAITEYLSSSHYEKLKFFHPKVEFEINSAPDLLNSMGSPVHLSKTVMNLISNAAEAMPEGGKVTISTKNQYLDKPVSGYDNIKEGEYIVLTVKDSGVGISQDDISRIFEPFFTKKVMGRSGTGLGLAIVWGTVQDHNGYIGVNSTPGKGTAFKLYFPATRKEIEDKKETLPIEMYSGHGESILVVDDVESQREIASHILTKLNYRVGAVASGEEAVEYLKSKPVDVVVLDMIMEPGIDGLETYRRMLEVSPKQKAIIASGFSATDRVTEAQKLGVGTYIKKPYLMGEFGIAIKTVLGK